MSRAEFREFAESPVGELWRWIVGGLPNGLARLMTPDDMEQTLQAIVRGVRDGADVQDYLQVRDHLKARLSRRIIGEMGPG